ERMLGMVADAGTGGAGNSGGTRGRGGSSATGAGGSGRGGDNGGGEQSAGNDGNGGEGDDGSTRADSGAMSSRSGSTRGQSSRGRSGAGQDGRSGASQGGRSGSASSADMRARFENATPEERQRMMAAMRGGAATVDRDPFGIGGRREPAVVFVYDAAGQLATRDIVVGARDWEYTEVLEGLSPGDELLILPSNSLLRSQDRLRSWAQGRSGIPGMGGGGPPPGMGRGRGRGF
ncbi:MAG: hypothetical protein PVJ51_13295, partial [Acidobacteriota bacterium]